MTIRNLAPDLLAGIAIILFAIKLKAIVQRESGSNGYAVAKRYLAPPLLSGAISLSLFLLLVITGLPYPGVPSVPAILLRAFLLSLFGITLVVTALGIFSRRAGTSEPEARPDAADLGEDTNVRLIGLTEEGKRQAVMASVQTLEEQIRGALHQARATVRADDLALYWRTEPEGPLRLRACRQSPPPAAQVLPGRGILGLAVDAGEPVRVNNGRGLRDAVPHAPGPVEALLAVPVFNRHSLLGLLVAHREAAEPFGETEERLLTGLGAQVLEFHRQARLMRRTEEERGRFKSLAELSHRLSRTLDLDEILSSVIRAGGALTGDAAVAVVLGEREDDLAVHWGADAAERTAGPAQLDGTLLGLALRDRTRLAIADLKGRERVTPALGPRLDPPGARSLLIQPLPFRHDARGAVVFFAPEPDAFPGEALDAAAMLADLAAVAIHNALLYRRMEEKAVRDGLTGLYNHRWFQERLADELERAERLRTRVALVICDLDHFKKVNDTHGHPAGDEVLRAAGRVLSASVRRTDAAARYGGEEFALILLGADARGAAELAERVRREVAKLSFRVGNRDFRVTLSLGIAVYPDHARTRADLIARADQALYRAKEGGRNRLVVAE